MPSKARRDVVIVGGGVAGRSAGMFTARHGLDTVILDAGRSLLKRNAHLENYPGFPAGVDARLLLQMMLDQAERAGCEYIQAEVRRIDPVAEGFEIRTEEGAMMTARYVIAATKNEVAYLTHLDGIELVERGKSFVDTDGRGRSGIPGLYVAGRLAQKPHQTIVNAGHGAEVAVTVLADDDQPFYHDWTAPERYFTGRDRDVPPGCEEIDREERLRREQESLEAMRAHFADPHPEPPEQHPRVRVDD